MKMVTAHDRRRLLLAEPPVYDQPTRAAIRGGTVISRSTVKILLTKLL
jgi:hypothetical protein